MPQHSGAARWRGMEMNELSGGGGDSDSQQEEP